MTVKTPDCDLMSQFTEIAGMTAQQMLEHEEILINAFDRDHRIIFWNKRCEIFFGISRDQALGIRLEDLLPYTKGHEKISILDRALMGKEVVILRSSYEKKQGFYEQRVVPVTNLEGEVMAVLNMVKDC